MSSNLKDKEKEQLLSSDGYGFNQYINFGKYKGQTFYDVANSGDFKYLIWLINTTKYANADTKGGNRFKLNNKALSHCERSLRTKTDPGTWEKTVDDMPMKKDHQLVYYRTNSGLHSPSIEYTKCRDCQKYRHDEHFNNQPYNCNKCLGISTF